jgi:hypothetical protein
MNYILKGISYIFHPLIMPLLGVLFYFEISPKFYPKEVIYVKLISLSILTIILPILLYFLLKTLGRVDSIELKTTKERIIPLAVNCLIVILILQRVISEHEILELYYFFLGILISTLTCLVLALAKFKASIHLIGISGLFMFFIALSIHFKININNTLALMCIITGAIATSRLHLEAHTYKELVLGIFVGVVPQLILINYWL